MSNIDYDGDGGLHIVDISEARTIDKSPFDRVVTVCQDSIEDNISADTEYDYFCMSDGAASGYSGDSSYKLFSRAANKVWRSLHKGETVLLHCHVGKSRSVSVATAALGRLLDIPRSEAYDIVRNYRPQAHPNRLLMGHAGTYIEQHTGHNPPFTKYKNNDN